MPELPEGMDREAALAAIDWSLDYIGQQNQAAYAAYLEGDTALAGAYTIAAQTEIVWVLRLLAGLAELPPELDWREVTKACLKGFGAKWADWVAG